MKKNFVLLILVLLFVISFCFSGIGFYYNTRNNKSSNNSDNDVKENDYTNNVKECWFLGRMDQGTKYVNGQYTYRYMQQPKYEDENTIKWNNIDEDGWSVILTNKDSTDSVTTELCNTVNGKPIISMQYMFYGSKANRIDLSSFNTSNVTNMSGMFYGASANRIDLSSFNTSNVTNMSGMFYGSKANRIDLSKLDTSKVTDMSYMFADSNFWELNLSNFDTSKVTNMEKMFSSLKAFTLDLSNFDTSKVTNMSGMFYNLNLDEINLSNFNTSNVVNMSYMFGLSKKLKLDLRSFDTSKVTNTDSMFLLSEIMLGRARTQNDADKFNQSSKKPKELNFVFGYIDSEPVYGGKNKFKNCSFPGELKQGEHYINGQYIYSYKQQFNWDDKNKRYYFENINLDGWGVGLVNDSDDSPIDTELCYTINGKPIVSMSYLFSHSSARSIDLSSFNTSNVRNMNSMFEDFYERPLDLSGFDTRNVIDMRRMFYEFETDILNLSSFDLSNSANLSEMFKDTQMFYGYAKNQAFADRFNDDVTKINKKTKMVTKTIDPNPVYGGNNKFKNCNFSEEIRQGTQYVNGQYLYIYKQHLEEDWVSGDPYFENFDEDGWSVKLVDKSSTEPIDTELCYTINGKPIVSMRQLFYESQSKVVNLDSFNTSNVVNMSNMFSYSFVENLNLSDFNTSNVTNMSGMFSSSKANKIDLSNFDTSNVKDMSYMFSSSEVNKIDLSSFDTSNVKDMSGMFYISKATTLDLSSFDTSNVKDMSYMFSSSKANKIDLSNFDTSNVKDMRYMFRDAKATTGYVRTQSDADKFNKTSGIPKTLKFVVK